MAVHRLVVPGWTPARHNQIVRRGGHRLKIRDRVKVANRAREQQVPKATARRRVTIELTLPKGARGGDPDSFFKSTHDALKHAGLLVNDSSRWLELTPPVYIRGATRSTTIILEDVEWTPPPKFKPPRRKPPVIPGTSAGSTPASNGPTPRASPDTSSRPPR